MHLLTSWVKLSQISASFQTFVAYSVGGTSVVLMGNRPTTPSDAPTVLPGLQNRNIVSVVLGDYHFGALTEDGTMLTWGKYSAGALGLGDPFTLPAGSPGSFPLSNEQSNPAPPMGYRLGRGRGRREEPPEVKEPTEVRFDREDHKRDKFVFAIAASGWHTAALVIDLQPNNPPAPSTSDVHQGPSTSQGLRNRVEGKTRTGTMC
jgi:SCF-associated factor 1